ncbi:unnamed protein product [Gongylonema pulchrum]|uniref:RRM domain-containing protein n=1 Tax=Gongylonema pulchrum TaxID=637853 RepID=A0A183E4L9_9BILA|nr:unnamed protein product [Gongylonema pulchrum]
METDLSDGQMFWQANDGCGDVPDNGLKPKRKRRRPRTKALRSAIREKAARVFGPFTRQTDAVLSVLHRCSSYLQIEKALFTDDSPIHAVMEKDAGCRMSALLTTVLNTLKVEREDYLRLSHAALISIGQCTSFFRIAGESRDTLRLYPEDSAVSRDACTVYVDNLPRGCKATVLEKWVAKFGAVAYVHPIFERKLNGVKGNAKEEASTAAGTTFFQCAFVRFFSDQAAQKLIKVFFHYDKRMHFLRRFVKSESSDATVPDASKEDIACTSHAASATTPDHKSSRMQRKRKRKPSCTGSKSIHRKKRKVCRVGRKTISTTAVEEPGVKEAEELLPTAPDRVNLDKNASAKQSSVNISDAALETSGGNNSEMTAERVNGHLKHAGTNTSQEFLQETVVGTSKKRKRVHRRKPLRTKPEFRVPCLKRYFSMMQLIMRAVKLRDDYYQTLGRALIGEDQLNTD